MHAIRRSPFTRFLVVPLTLLALLSGCSVYKWATWGGPDALHSSRDLPDRVRVKYDAGAVAGVVFLESASVVGDSLIGAGVSGNEALTVIMSLHNGSPLRSPIS